MSAKIGKLIVFLLLLATGMEAQLTLKSIPKEDVVIVTMKNGEQYHGVIVSNDAKNLVLKTEVAEITLISSAVDDIEPYNYNSRFNYSQRFYSKYFFGQSSIPLKKKEGYYQNTSIILNSFSVGITENLSITAGLELLSTIFSRNSAYFVGPKFGFKVSQETYASVGALIVKIPNQEVTIFSYATLTFGSKDSNVTVGAGYSVLNSRFDEELAYNLSAMHRFSKRLALVTENYFLPLSGSDDVVLGIQGLRYFKRNNVFDFGAIVFYDTSFTQFFIPFPYVSYARAF